MSNQPASEPVDYGVVEYDDQPFVGLTRTLTMDTLSEAADELPGLVSWVVDHGGEPSGAPFMRYVVIDMAANMVVQVGVPVVTPPDTDGGFEADVLPGGRYATTVHVGGYDGLYDSTVGLLTWAGENGLPFDYHEGDGGDHWASRLEIFETDPTADLDPTQWRTRLAFKLRD